MAKWQRDLYFEHKELTTPEIKGMMFVTEKDLRDKRAWSKSTFNFGAACRNVLVILRTIGKIKEVRGKGNTRFVVI